MSFKDNKQGKDGCPEMALGKMAVHQPGAWGYESIPLPYSEGAWIPSWLS